MGHQKKRCAGARSLASSSVRASVCYLNEDVQHIRLSHFVFPKLLDIEWCNLHGGCREGKDSEEINIIGTLSSLSVHVNMHRHVWYFCMCVGQATVCLPEEHYNSSRFPRNPTESHTALNKRNAIVAEWQTEKLANDNRADEIKSKD